MRYYYGPGARGFVVKRLQTALGLQPDGVFGRSTTAAVVALQQKCFLSISGRAGEAEFEAARLDWPSDFQRCMNFVSNLEGTSFGDCNRTDIDGAGLTMGIAGFTSGHGEVQELLRAYCAAKPGAVTLFPNYTKFCSLLSRKAAAAEWKQFFFNGGGNVAEEWQKFISRAGSDPVMQDLQLTMAKGRFWKPAYYVCNSLGFKSVQSQCFFLDVAVQNGGWRKSHNVIAKCVVQWQSNFESERLVAAAHAVAACAKARWQADVLTRKLAIARGQGVVHGRTWTLCSHALTHS